MTMKFVYDRQSLTSLQSNNRNIHLTNAAWRAAVSAGVSLRRPTKRGYRGGVHRQHKIVPIVGHRPVLLSVREPTGANATNLRQCASKNIMINANMIHASKLCICTLNPWSVCNETTTLHDFLIDQQLDLFALTETWLTGTDMVNAIISSLLPNGYNIKHNHRQTRGGGTAIIHRNSLKVSTVSESQNHPSFEGLECIVTSTQLVRLSVIYRPPPSTKNKTTHKQFLAEFADYLGHIVTTPGMLLIVCDFNYHVEDTSDSEACSFNTLIDSFGLIQHVADITYRSGHTLDLTLSRSHDSLVLPTRSIDYGFPDHFPVLAHLSLRKPPLPTREVTYRKLKTITKEVLLEAISTSALCTASVSTMSLHVLTTLYDTELRKIVDALTPTKTRIITVRTEAEWYNESIREVKQTRRQSERLWRKTGLVVDREVYMETRDMVNALIDQEKRNHYQSIIAENQGNTKQLFSVVHLLLGKSKTKPLPSDKSASELCSLFGDFFVEKISQIRNPIPTESNDDNPEVLECSSTMTFFETVTVEEITKLVTSMTIKSCELDPMPTSFVKEAIGALAPKITYIVNGSLTSGVFPSCYKEALVTPLLKNQSLDCNRLQNYRPVSNLALISKTIEKVVSAQLNTYLKDNNLLEPCQSAYRQGHSTETALVRVQNDIICAVG